MFSKLAFGALVGLAFACDDPRSDPCALAFSVSSAAAATFCGTYTQAVHIAPSGLPAFASACAFKPKHISSACSCIVGGKIVATSAATPLKTTLSTLISKPTTAVSVSVKPATPAVISTQATTAAATLSRATIPAVAVASIKASSGGTTCTVTAYGGIASAVAACTNILLSGIAAPASSSVDLTKLKSGTTVTFAGKTTFGYTADSDFDPIVIGGTDITIQGAAGHVIDGNGQAYWDGEGSNGDSDKPDRFIVAKDMTNAVFKNLNIQNWPTHCFDVTGGDTMTFSNVNLNNEAGDTTNSKSGSKPAAHNSDGVDFSSSNDILLTDSTVYNQDDCVAITSGTNLTVNNMYCSGGHGLSIGFVGGKSNNVVEDVTFQNSVVVDSQNGCCIKSNSGTTGTISKITYSNITMSGITDYGIDVQQDYLNGGATGEPTNGVKISGVSFVNVTGTMSDGQDYYILCGSGSCSGFTFSGVDITGGSGDSCNYPTSNCP